MGGVLIQSDEALNDSDKVLSVPSGEIWRILNIHVELVTTATVGNRQMRVEIRDDADDIIGQFSAGAVQAASLTVAYEFMPGVARETAVVDSSLLVPIPLDLILPGLFDFRVYDQAAVDAAADDMVIQALVEVLRG